MHILLSPTAVRPWGLLLVGVIAEGQGAPATQTKRGTLVEGKASTRLVIAGETAGVLP